MARPLRSLLHAVRHRRFTRRSDAADTLPGMTSTDTAPAARTAHIDAARSRLNELLEPIAGTDLLMRLFFHMHVSVLSSWEFAAIHGQNLVRRVALE